MDTGRMDTGRMDAGGSWELLRRVRAFALPFYQHAGRAYHNEQHARAMLLALGTRGVLTPALALAVWGHDLIYDPRAQDNEQRSADAFGAWLAQQGAPDDLRAEVHALILATRHTDPPTTCAQALLLDADLGILGAAPPQFAAYDAAIRREYAHVPEPAYRAGRRRVLEGFLGRGRLYVTPEFAPLEAQARENLEGALALLR